MPSGPISVFWFRRDLRLHDNHGLHQALAAGRPVLPVFVFDKQILDPLPDPKDRRVTFIYRALQDIQAALAEAGSSLWVIHDTPAGAFDRICAAYDVEAVYTNHDYEPYAVERDDAIKRQLGARGIAFHTFKDQVVFERDEVVKGDGTPYTVFTPYSKAWKAKYLAGGKVRYPSERMLDACLKTAPLPFPALPDIGFGEADEVFPEPAADKAIITHYDQTRNFPAVRGTSRLSVHLRFGTVSARELVAAASAWNETWLNELIWREFFMMILWHFPHVVTKSFKPQYDAIAWRNDPAEFDKWCRGETGYPLVDAGMRELNATGFMHNRVRMVVASFLTKDLLIDWRWGESYFAEKLIDYELSANNGNWQWAAGCGCDAAPYFRIFNPAEQQKKFDPDFTYIRRWIADFRPDYLPPIVDHAFARERTLAAYKRALAQS